jgi:hypothetical protein
MEENVQVVFVVRIRRVNKPTAEYFCDEMTLNDILKIAGDVRGDINGVKADKYIAVLNEPNYVVQSVYGKEAQQDFYKDFEENADARADFTQNALNDIFRGV